MNRLIKYIRASSNMNQEQFASVIGTTVQSINRWENGKALPNPMAQKQLYQFCLDNHIPICDHILQSKELPSSDSKLILYHGSKNGLQGEIAPISREACDFGKGFYMGTTTLQPLTLICAEAKPKLYTLELDLTGLKVLQMGIDMDWAMLIAYFRREMEGAKDTPIYNKYAHFADGYDIIVGCIANDRMYTQLSKFFNRTLTDVALIHCLSALDLGMQYVAVTEKACKQIRILKEDPLHPLELSALMDLSVSRRKNGIALAEDIEVKYRRDGKYFDEILRGGSNE